LDWAKARDSSLTASVNKAGNQWCLWARDDEVNFALLCESD
jgi:hypothetical protein